MERLESYKPAWPLPKIFRMTSGGKLIAGLFEGETINTPSMLANEDYIDALTWAQSLGGQDGLIARSNANAAALDAWVQRTPWVANLAVHPAHQSTTSVCLKIVDPVHAANPDVPKKMAAMLEKMGVAYDIGAYRDAPPGLRIWCGATVNTADILALTPWLDWAFAEATAQ